MSWRHAFCTLNQGNNVDWRKVKHEVTFIKQKEDASSYLFNRIHKIISQHIMYMKHIAYYNTNVTTLFVV
jgi:hypothetical protein